MVSLEIIALAVGSAKLRYITLLNELYDELQKGCCGDQQSIRCLLGLITALEMDIKDGINDQTTQDIYKKLLDELAGYSDNYVVDPLVVFPDIEIGLVAVNWGQIGGNIYNQIDLINLLNTLTGDLIDDDTISLIKTWSSDKINTFVTNLTTNVLPYGLKGQIIKVNQENTNEYITQDLITEGNYISTDEELDLAKETFITQQQIFETWPRYSVGGNPSNPTIVLIDGKIPQRADQTNSWEYDSVSDLISSTFNTGSHIGFISKIKLAKYKHSVTLKSTATDDDNIGLLIAYVEDMSDMVLNHAFGLNPNDFTWPIDVTNQYIPNQHTLTLMRNRGGITGRYSVWYNYNKPDMKIVTQINIPNDVTGNWLGSSVDVEVDRNYDIIKTRTTRFSDDPQGKGFLDFEMQIDLNSDPLLLKFKSPCSYGYCVQSQANSTFENIIISVNINEIYDLRNGDVWIANSAGIYSKSLTRNLFNELLPRTIVWNSTTDKYYWIDSDFGWHWINKTQELQALNFLNGLRKDGNDVKLGLDIATWGTTNKGILTEDVYLIKGSPSDNLFIVSLTDLQFGVIHKNMISLSVNAENSIRFSMTETAGSFSSDYGPQFSFDADSETTGSAQMRSNFYILQLLDSTEEAVFIDYTENPKGLGESEDYSENKGPLSYVTKIMLQKSSGFSGTLSTTDNNIRTSSNPGGSNILRFAHGLGVTPTNWQLNGTNPASQSALASSTQTADDTYVTIIPDFTNNDGSPINIQWIAKL